ncbi:hypothetical protein An12g04200 [Aspergillus niger]|uniref:Uncharacterized protein n=2 Tax=Aspergillus niger TaxID=5061 RepID=A2QZA5_ASPNC|nr:hypothetical protein An12g04200 [Aspergillus niger]CAK46190.1 hypothetical protein An12g04200 [Aspergillus niger]
MEGWRRWFLERWMSSAYQLRLCGKRIDGAIRLLPGWAKSNSVGC